VEWGETMQGSGTRLRSLIASVLPLLAVGLVAWALLILDAGVGSAEESAEDSCVECHGDPDFLFTNKKLHDYFQIWKDSTHAQEGVSCSDCHGGNSDASGKKAAHLDDVGGEESAGSAVNFRNIPDTCGTCHEEIYEGFRESDHFDHLVRKKQEKQGPNCVTCHGSLNVVVLNVSTVGEACSRCRSLMKSTTSESRLFSTTSPCCTPCSFGKAVACNSCSPCQKLKEPSSRSSMPTRFLRAARAAAVGSRTYSTRL